MSDKEGSTGSPQSDAGRDEGTFEEIELSPDKTDLNGSTTDHSAEKNLNQVEEIAGKVENKLLKNVGAGANLHNTRGSCYSIITEGETRAVTTLEDIDRELREGGRGSLHSPITTGPSEVKAGISGLSSLSDVQNYDNEGSVEEMKEAVKTFIQHASPEGVGKVDEVYPWVTPDASKQHSVDTDDSGGMRLKDMSLGGAVETSLGVPDAIAEQGSQETVPADEADDRAIDGSIHDGENLESSGTHIDHIQEEEGPSEMHIPVVESGQNAEVVAVEPSSEEEHISDVTASNDKDEGAVAQEDAEREGADPSRKVSGTEAEVSINDPAEGGLETSRGQNEGSASEDNASISSSIVITSNQPGPFSQALRLPEKKEADSFGDPNTVEAPDDDDNFEVDVATKEMQHKTMSAAQHLLQRAKASRRQRSVSTDGKPTPSSPGSSSDSRRKSTTYKVVPRVGGQGLMLEKIEKKTRIESFDPIRDDMMEEEWANNMKLMTQRLASDDTELSMEAPSQTSQRSHSVGISSRREKDPGQYREDSCGNHVDPEAPIPPERLMKPQDNISPPLQSDGTSKENNGIRSPAKSPDMYLNSPDLALAPTPKANSPSFAGSSPSLMAVSPSLGVVGKSGTSSSLIRSTLNPSSVGTGTRVARNGNFTLDMSQLEIPSFRSLSPSSSTGKRSNKPTTEKNEKDTVFARRVNAQRAAAAAAAKPGGSGSSGQVEEDWVPPALQVAPKGEPRRSSKMKIVSLVPENAKEYLKKTKSSVNLTMSFSPKKCSWRRDLCSDRPPPTQAWVGVKNAIRNIGLGVRLLRHNNAERSQGKVPIIDPFTKTQKSLGGVPMGGIGGGCIMRGFRGDFRRWSLRPGIYKHGAVGADQFSVRIERSSADPDKDVKTVKAKVMTSKYVGNGNLKAWNWEGFQPGSATYHALYPRAWTIYEDKQLDPDIHISCLQISPVIPNNYTDSSTPATVFKWKFRNISTSPAKVTVMFTWQNGYGTENDTAGGHINTSFNHSAGKDRVIGVELHHRHRTPVVVPSKAKDGATPASRELIDPLTFAIACRANGRTKVTYRTRFVTNSDGADVWNDFYNDGELDNVEDDNPSTDGVAIGAAVCATVVVLPNTDNAVVEFSLSWDMPIARFGSGRGYYRRYTKFYGTDGCAAPKMATDALMNHALWEREVEEWQGHVVFDKGIPNWYKCTLFNELYFITDGGTLWTYREETEEEREARVFLIDFDEEAASEALGRTRAVTQGAVDKKGKSKKGKEEKKTLKSMPRRVSNAGRITNDFLELQDESCLEKGISLVEVMSGKVIVIHSLRDIPQKIRLLTDRNTPLERVTDRVILLDGTTKLRVPQPPNSPARRGSMGNGVYQMSFIEDRVEELRLESGQTDSPTGVYDESPEEMGHFAYLESQEYLMYNTYDVHFYASFALAMTWPKLELSVQRDFAKALLDDDDEEVPLLAHSGSMKRNVYGAVPHDLGSPSEDPWYKVNSYNIHDTSSWKDLNPKFVLQIYRDYIVTQDDGFLREMWEPVKVALAHASKFDKDGDGLLDNEGFPDQTYDAWSVTGASTYCGSLWVAALSAAAAIARTLHEDDFADHYGVLYQKACVSFESKLWNGKYYNYDSSNSYVHDSIMADQLAGQWYARACGLDSIVPVDHAKSAFSQIFEYNVERFGNIGLGAVNGMRPSGHMDESSVQSREVWTGTSYALAAAMLQEGMSIEGFETARRVYQGTYEDYGYWFMTPEAWDESGGYRSLGYMRALSIWSVQWAYDHRGQPQFGNLPHEPRTSVPAPMATLSPQDARRASPTPSVASSLSSNGSPKQ